MNSSLITLILILSFTVPTYQQYNTTNPEVTDEHPGIEKAKNESEPQGNASMISNDPDKIVFYLCPSPEDLGSRDELKYKNRESIEKSRYNETNPAVFIIHGFLNNASTMSSQVLKNGFLQAGYADKFNIILVDWGQLSTPANASSAEPGNANNDAFYRSAVANVPKAGKRVSDFIKFLIAEEFLPSPSSAYIIGFSLGAHVAGNIVRSEKVSEHLSQGKSLSEHLSAQQRNIRTEVTFTASVRRAKVSGHLSGCHTSCSTGTYYDNRSNSGVAGSCTRQNDGIPVFRITGLDPAGPLYQNDIGMENKLDSTDAYFVDVIHTNQGQEGYYGSMGHVDFFPNGGGPNQPGCHEHPGAVPDSVTGSCSHNKVWKYYIKSLSEQIIACKCISHGDVVCRNQCQQKTLFGYPCPPTARGNYYLDIVA